nr:hypothetical protein HK105_002125 [Polyrhizophydium stewartii]
MFTLGRSHALSHSPPDAPLPTGASHFDRLPPELRDRCWIPTMVANFVRTEYTEFIEWMHVRCPGSVTPRALDLAVECGAGNSVSFLLDDIKDIDWDRTRALDPSEQHGCHQIITMIDKHMGGDELEWRMKSSCSATCDRCVCLAA